MGILDTLYDPAAAAHESTPEADASSRATPDELRQANYTLDASRTWAQVNLSEMADRATPDELRQAHYTLDASRTWAQVNLGEPRTSAVAGPAEGQALTPTDQDMAAITQTVADPEVERSQARAELEAEAPLAASTAELRSTIADHAPSEGIGDTLDEPEAVDFVQVAPEEPAHDVRLTQELLQRMRWSDLESNDPDQRSQAMAAGFYLRRVVTTGVAHGHEAALAQVWKAYAGPEAPSFEDIMRRRRSTPLPPLPSVVIAPVVAARPVPEPERAAHDLAVRPLSSFDPAPTPVFPQRPAQAIPAKSPSQAAVEKPAPPVPQGNGGGGGFGFSDLVKMPFAMVGSAGSMVLAGLGRAGQAAQGAYVRSRINGHEVLGGQVAAHAQTVVTLSAQLRRQGMGEVVDAIRRTGAPPAEVFEGMREGGKYDALGKKYDRLMKQPDVARTFADLQSHMSKFEQASRRYARTGAELNLDVDTPVRRGSEAMIQATEGLPIKEGGAFKHLQDRLQEMTARIVEMIERLFNRLMPGHA